MVRIPRGVPSSKHGLACGRNPSPPIRVKVRGMASSLLHWEDRIQAPPPGEMTRKLAWPMLAGSVRVYFPSDYPYTIFLPLLSASEEKASRACFVFFAL